MVDQKVLSRCKSEFDNVGCIMTLKLQLANALTESDNAKHLASAIAIENKILSTKLEEMQKRCAALEEQNKGLTQVVNHLQINAKETSKEKYELRAKMEEYQVQRDRYKDRLDPILKENSRLKAEREELMAGVVEVRVELERERSNSTYHIPQVDGLHGSESNLDVNGEQARRQDLNTEEETIKNAALSLRKWSYMTFGRRHSSLLAFFDDELLDCDDDDASSLCSKTVASEEHVSREDQSRQVDHSKIENVDTFDESNFNDTTQFSRPFRISRGSRNLIQGFGDRDTKEKARKRFSIRNFVDDISQRLTTETVPNS